MKRILCLLLCAAMLFAFAACNGNDADSSTESSEESVAPPKEPIINGNALADFTVVYKSTNTNFNYKGVAEQFVSYVKDTFGIELPMRSDAVPENEKEIIFGWIHSRAICKDNQADMDIGGYEIIVSGNKLLINSSSVNGCYAGFEALLEKIKASPDGVFNDQKIEGEKKLIKVACVGDSITQGINSTDTINMTYPAYIQQMLGYDYYVLNAGLSGYSICKIDVYAYYKSKQYLQARELKPDVVLFALGTNDANPTPSQPYKNWEDPQYDRTNVFIESTNELLDAFVDINPDVQIYMILPASLFKVGNDGWSAEAWTENIVKYAHPLLKQIAEERKLPTVDLFPWSRVNKAVFTDGLHPKDETYKTFAQFIYDSIKDTIKKPE